MKGAKIKESFMTQDRISLFQTCMNNAGRNFEGKKVTVQKMFDFAAGFYKLAIKEIENIGELSLDQVKHTIVMPTKKIESKSKLQAIMKKIKKQKKR